MVGFEPLVSRPGGSTHHVGVLSETIACATSSSLECDVVAITATGNPVHELPAERRLWTRYSPSRERLAGREAGCRWPGRSVTRCGRLAGDFPSTRAPRCQVRPPRQGQSTVAAAAAMNDPRVERQPDPCTPTTPSGFSAIFGHDPTNRVFFAVPVHKEDGPPQYDVACRSFSFLIKLFQLLTSIVTAGLYSEGIYVVHNDITSQQLPFVVTSAFIIITSIIILSYVLGQKMPEVLIRMFNLLAMLLFAVTGIVILNIWIQYHGGVQNSHGENKIDQNNTGVTQDEQSEIEDCDEQDYIKFKPWQVEMLLAVAILCLVNSFLYALDFIISIKRTLNIISQ